MLSTILRHWQQPENFSLFKVIRLPSNEMLLDDLEAIVRLRRELERKAIGDDEDEVSV